MPRSNPTTPGQRQEHDQEARPQPPSHWCRTVFNGNMWDMSSYLSYSARTAQRHRGDLNAAQPGLNAAQERPEGPRTVGPSAGLRWRAHARSACSCGTRTPLTPALAFRVLGPLEATHGGVPCAWAAEATGRARLPCLRGGPGGVPRPAGPGDLGRPRPGRRGRHPADLRVPPAARARAGSSPRRAGARPGAGPPRHTARVHRRGCVDLSRFEGRRGAGTPRCDGASCAGGGVRRRAGLWRGEVLADLAITTSSPAARPALGAAARRRWSPASTPSSAWDITTRCSRSWGRWSPTTPSARVSTPSASSRCTGWPAVRGPGRVPRPQVTADRTSWGSSRVPRSVSSTTGSCAMTTGLASHHLASGCRAGPAPSSAPDLAPPPHPGARLPGAGFAPWPWSPSASPRSAVARSPRLWPQALSLAASRERGHRTRRPDRSSRRYRSAPTRSRWLPPAV